MFKKMVAALIGKETAKLHKKDIVIKNLPNLPAKVKNKKGEASGAGTANP